MRIVWGIDLKEIVNKEDNNWGIIMMKIVHCPQILLYLHIHQPIFNIAYNKRLNLHNHLNK